MIFYSKCYSDTWWRNIHWFWKPQTAKVDAPRAGISFSMQKNNNDYRGFENECHSLKSQTKLTEIYGNGSIQKRNPWYIMNRIATEYAMRKLDNATLFDINALFYCTFIPLTIPNDVFSVTNWGEFINPVLHFVCATGKQIGLGYMVAVDVWEKMFTVMLMIGGWFHFQANAIHV